MQRRIVILALLNLILFPAATIAASGEAASLEDAVQAVKGMIAQGKPRGEIAAWVTKTVDGRITALNRNEADERGGMHASAYDVARESFDAWSEAGVGVCKPAKDMGRLDFTMTKAGFQEINRVATWSYANYLKKYRLWLGQCEDLAGS